MATRERLRDRGRRRGTDDVVHAGQELRRARTNAGLSLRSVASAAGISAAQVLRVEHGRVPTVSAVTLATIGAVVGLDVRIHLYPGGDPLRDAGQTRLLQRLRSRLHRDTTVRWEVPLPKPGDQRAWDAWLAGLQPDPATARSTLPVEGETRIQDFQSFARRLTLKLRDSEEPFVLVVLADTPGNRAAIAAAGPAVRDAFPVSTRAALHALAEGRHPGGSAIVFL